MIGEIKVLLVLCYELGHKKMRINSPYIVMKTRPYCKKADHFIESKIFSDILNLRKLDFLSESEAETLCNKIEKVDTQKDFK